MISLTLLLSSQVAQTSQPPSPPDDAPTKRSELPVETDFDRTPSVKTNGRFLIVNARILPVGAKEIPSGWIRVRGGKIEALGAGNQSARDGEKVFDVKGAIVTPGLIDAHTHIASDATNEGSETITPEARILDVLDAKDVGLWQKLAGGCTTSLTLHGSANPIGGESVIIKHRWGAKPDDLPMKGAPRIVKFALGENVKSGSRTSPRYPGTRGGVDATIRQGFIAARNYLALKRSGKPYRKDLRLEALADMIEGRLLVHSHAYRADEMLTLMRTSNEFGVTLLSFQHALEAYMIAPELAAGGVGASIFSDAWAGKYEMYDSIPYSAAILSRKGVLTSVNTDTGGGNTPFNLEAAKGLRYGGLSPETCLEHVTLNAAKALRIDRWVGSLAPGKDADIVVWDGHPMSVYSRVRRTFLDGELVFERRDAFGLDAAARKGMEPSVAGGEALAPAKPANAYLIRGATVHTEPGKTSSAPVLVVDGRIARVGDGPTPSGTVTVSAKGLHLYPGFMDLGTDTGLVEFGQVSQVSDVGEFGENNADLLASRTIDPRTEHVPVGRIAGVTNVVARFTGGTIRGRSGLLRMNGRTTDELVQMNEWALSVAPPAGISALDDYAQRTMPDDDQERLARFDQSAAKRMVETFARAQRYAKARLSKADVAVDPRLEAMIPFVMGEKPVVFVASDRDTILSALALSKRFGLKAVIEGGKESWKVAWELKAANVPVILDLPSWSRPEAASDVMPLSRFDPYDAWWSTPALLQREGVRFAFCTGGGGNAYTLPYRAGQAVAYGLPRDAAIRALTQGAAEILGIEKEMGSIAPGKRATFFLSTGDPLEMGPSVVMMWIDGKPVDLRENKWTRLYETYRTR